MDIKNIAVTIAALVCVVVIFSSVAVPVINSAMTTAGDEITLKNDSAVVLREIQDGDVLKCTVIDASTDSWTLNDEPILSLSESAVSWNVGLISDGVYLQINSGANASPGSYYDMSLATPSVSYLSGTQGYIYTFEAADGAINITTPGGTTTEYPYTWGYVVCTYADGQYYSAESTGTGICKTANDLILCGTYTTGALDTAYTYRNGVAAVSNSSYTMAVPYTMELHEGTTDIYDIDVTVEISDGVDTETFTPYRIYLPYEITGHEDSGAAYSLLGIVPVLIAVGIVLGVVGAVLSRRE